MAYTEKAMPVGGLTEEKLALATATEGNVLNGKTFYSGDKILKTGALAVSDLYTTRTVSASVSYSDGGKDFSFNAPVVDGYTCIGGGFTDIVHNNGWYFSAANLHCNASRGYGQLKPDGGGTNGVHAIFFYIKNI